MPSAMPIVRATGPGRTAPAPIDPSPILLGDTLALPAVSGSSHVRWIAVIVPSGARIAATIADSVRPLGLCASTG